MDRVKETFQFPTEFHILDGSDGKPAALNTALEHLLTPHTAPFYVTMDDDYIPPQNWQQKAVQAFEALPKLGALSFWVGEDPELQQLIGAFRLDPPTTIGPVTVRKVQRGHHINGAIVVYRREVALAVGPQPITAEKYQVWEDAWRGRKVQSLGWELTFVEADLPEFIVYDDPEEYLAWRNDQVRLSRKDQDKVLRTSGISDSPILRLRRLVARLRGRAKE